ncbi:MAG TPA: hypothetical protein VMW16_11095 [Sedimentisphaerales bacterium]|nr:hypothetical protein [Sedimentisphaerales bacterium]
MTKAILTAVLVVLLNVLVGCETVDSGKSQLVTGGNKMGFGSARTVEVGKAGETDIVERVAVNRQAYREGLELLVEYYNSTGNSMKLAWAQKELAALAAMPQYHYIVEAAVAGPGLKAAVSSIEADYMFRAAMDLEKQAEAVPLIKDERLLRLALDKYNEMIKKHPSSDKIDDAAYRAGGICEHFKDYTIALLYYQRAYQWDPATPYPARFREGFILDERLHRRAEALEAYQRALNSLRREGEHYNWKEYAEKRVSVLTKSEEGAR